MDVYVVMDDDRTLYGVCDNQNSAEWLVHELQEDHPSSTFIILPESVRSYPST